MKVDYASDLHMNHHVPFMKDQLKWEARTREWAKNILRTGYGSVLIIAGDFSEWNRQAFWFLEEASSIYEKVFFVTGNHDYYLISKNRKRKYKDSKARQQALIESSANLTNVQPLNRDVISYNGKTFAGDSLWYIPKTPDEWLFFFNESNDSNYIYLIDRYPYGFTTKEEEVHFLYQEAMDWYNTLSGKNIDLMVSHIPPVHPPISPFARNACYDCPVSFLAAKTWICGHQHIQGDFEKAGTLFWMNAIGYPIEKNMITLKTIEI
ncbi:hypothetical protein HOO54_11530 [Bacillus sp. WMMC1349]|uniref:metallophosphoesterase family protein n=1 Tax=Bacillus sp. WMMC1349 TaxID=2736254 RepID=UPI0015536F8A|nr:metallophosphoesterase [Bacillus sp. WMMC1349]NPC92845.1 hypothetical protein [Bacillus sp. WMMC1349]